MSIGLGRESYENENDWLNDNDRAVGTICLALDDSLYYLNLGSTEYPKDLWTKLDRTFGKHNEDYNSTLEITSNTTRFLYSKGSASTLSYEVVKDEDEAKSSTHSIRIEESLHEVTPFLMLRKFMRSLISHVLILLKQKKTFESLILNKNTSALPCKHSLVIFRLNSVQNLPVIASESEEKFDFFSSNVVASVKICKNLDIFE